MTNYYCEKCNQSFISKYDDGSVKTCPKCGGWAKRTNEKKLTEFFK